MVPVSMASFWKTIAHVPCTDNGILAVSFFAEKWGSAVPTPGRPSISEYPAAADHNGPVRALTGSPAIVTARRPGSAGGTDAHPASEFSSPTPAATMVRDPTRTGI